MELINYKEDTEEENAENIFSEIIVKINETEKKLLKDLSYIKINDNLRLYYLKKEHKNMIETSFRYEWIVFAGDGFISIDINSDYKETAKNGWNAKTGYVSKIAEGTFTDWDGIRHSHYFDEGYFNYIDEHLNDIIKMFETIRDCQKYVEEHKTLEGY